MRAALTIFLAIVAIGLWAIYVGHIVRDVMPQWLVNWTGAGLFVFVVFYYTDQILHRIFEWNRHRREAKQRRRGTVTYQTISRRRS